MALSKLFPVNLITGSVECLHWAFCVIAPPIHHTGTWWNLRSTRTWLYHEYGDVLGGWNGVILKMHLEAIIVCTWRWTWKLVSGGLKDAHRDYDQPRVTLNMGLIMELEWKCTSKPQLTQLAHTLRGCYHLHFHRHMLGVIKWVGKCTRMSSFSQCWNQLGGQQHVNWKVHSDGVML